MSDDTSDALYEALARWQWSRRPRSAAPGQGLELRKRLLPRMAGADEPADGAAGLDVWLQSLLGERPRGRVLDLGCGFGASVFRWALAGSTCCVGLTPSAFQVARATEVAARLGLAATCTFVTAEFAQAPPGPFDVVLAMEALGHARDLPEVLERVREVLAPRGCLLWVEDVAVAGAGPVGDDEDTQMLARYWASPPLRTADAGRRAIAAAGLRVVREVDLTRRVPVGALASNLRRARLLRGLRTLLPLPFVRRCTAAFLGGLALERLYGKGRVSYRVWMIERSTEHA